MKKIWLWIYLLLGIVLGDDILLPPIVSGGTQKMLVIFQGAYVPNSLYVPLAKAIQTQSSLSLWIGIPQFPFNLPDPLQSYFSVQSLVSTAQNSGFSGNISSDVFISGHSLGGIVARTTLEQNPFVGLILFGSYLSIDGNDDLVSHQGPVLTIGGELDGLTRITRMAVEYSQWLQVKQSKGQDFALRNKPVVVLSGVSHSQFADNITISGDLSPEIPTPKAHQLIAKIVTSFLTIQTSTSNSAIQAAIQVVNQAESQTDSLTLSFRQAQQLEAYSWCSMAQLDVANLTSGRAQLTIVQNSYSNIVSFAESKPSLSNGTSLGSVAVSTATYNSFTWNPFDVSTNPVSANQIYCKMKSQDAIVTSLQTSSNGTEASCQRINIKAQEVAFKLASSAAIVRYQKIGIPLEFLTDTLKSTGITWLSSSLQFGPSGDQPGYYSVQSPALYTDLSAPLGLGGMHYCVLLSPAKVVEWMLIDGLPKLS